MIDDVWSLPAWEAIHIRLPENNCSSRIIVTTRIESVAKASSVSEDLVHHMEPLEPKASQKLFLKIVFGSTGTCPDGLEDIMKNIFKKCSGLPLAIVSICQPSRKLQFECRNVEENV
jgi:disease resistance protein RPM1